MRTKTNPDRERLFPNIPAELKNLSQWVLWNYSDSVSNGKSKKIPIDPNTLTGASVKDPKTWVTFDDALGIFREFSTEYEGLGFVFTKDDPYVGFDFDNVRNRKSGNLSCAAQVEKLDSYAELSPSGTGVHVIVKGKLPPGSSANGKFEVYSSGRYFTFTGQRLKGAPRTIEERQNVIDELCQKGVGSNGQGTFSGSNPSIDQIREGQRNNTLTSIAGTMRRQGMSEALIRTSSNALNNASCDPLLPENEVAQIAKSVSNYPPGMPPGADGAAKTQPPEISFLSPQEIMDDDTAAPGWIAEPIAAPGCMTEIIGTPKESGKTTFSLAMVNRVLRGQDFLGKPTKQCGVVYLTEENPATFKIALKRAGLADAKNLSILSWFRASNRPWPEIANMAVEECRRKNAKLLVVDTWGRFTNLEGDRENSSGEVLAAVAILQEALGRDGLAVTINHHDRKKGGGLIDSGRGSNALPGAADNIVSLKRVPGRNDRVRELSVIGRITSTKLLIELTENDGYKVVGISAKDYKAKAEPRVFQAIPPNRSEAVTIEELENGTDISRSQIQRLIDQYIRSGQVFSSGDGKKGDPLRYYRNQEEV